MTERGEREKNDPPTAEPDMSTPASQRPPAIQLTRVNANAMEGANMTETSKPRDNSAEAKPRGRDA